MADRPVRHVWRSALLAEGGPSAAARLVGCAFAEHVFGLEDSANPGAARLAELSGLSVRKVKAALSELESAGWLVTVTRGGVAGGPRTSRRAIRVPEVIHMGAPHARVTGAPHAHIGDATRAQIASTRAPRAPESGINQVEPIGGSASSPVDKVRDELAALRQAKKERSHEVG